MRLKIWIFFLGLGFVIACVRSPLDRPHGEMEKEQSQELPVEEPALDEVDDAPEVKSNGLLEELVWKPTLLGDYPPSVRRQLSRLLDFTNNQLPTKVNLAEVFSQSRQVLPQDERLINAWLAERLKIILFDEASDSYVPGKGAQVRAENLGADLYLRAKNGETNRVFEPVVGIQILVESPRVGLVRLYRALFASEFLIDMSHPRADSNLLEQASVWVHEARHSDGSGEHVGFAHVLCPPTHEYEYMAACDGVENGSYRASAELLQGFLNQCTDCSELERSAVKIQILDQMNRINEDALWVDDQPENKMLRND